MKKLLFIVLFPLFVFAQDIISKPKLSVISLDKVKVVYRGIDNPITVAVPNAKDYWVSGPGVSKTNEDGKYIIRPGSGNELKIVVAVKLEDDSIVTEEHIYQIKGLPRLTGTLNDEFSTQGLLNFRKEDLKDAIVGIKLIDFIYSVNFNTISFILKDENNNKLLIEGNTINEEGFKFIRNINKDSLLFITEIRYPHSVESTPKPVDEIIINLTD